MNEEPHAHEINVRDWGHSWSIAYGDQQIEQDKPFRWFWDSEKAYRLRCARLLKSRITSLIQKHDEISQALQYGSVKFPIFARDKWGSEQL